MTYPDELSQALTAVSHARAGDSNDDEFAALYEALAAALTYIGVLGQAARRAGVEV